MRRLTLRLAVALFTFILGIAVTLVWYVSHRADSLNLPESDAERETRLARFEEMSVRVPFCELVRHPKVYENSIVSVAVSYPPMIPYSFTGSCPEGNDSVRIELESEKVRSDSEQMLAVYDKEMDHCWAGAGTIVGKFEAVDRKDDEQQKEVSYKFTILRLDKPEFVISCAESMRTPAP
ncbi:MAG: hypothetical protein QOF61_2468 [Acidobacteriota bacterium]|nr:hypothetical protein [Acidobacteriota bacterium]